MFSKILLVPAALMLLAAPATAAEQTADKSPPRAQEKTYCLQLEPFTGSRLSRTECKTKKEWAQDGVNVDELQTK